MDLTADYKKELWRATSDGVMKLSGHRIYEAYTLAGMRHAGDTMEKHAKFTADSLLRQVEAGRIITAAAAISIIGLPEDALAPALPTDGSAMLRLGAAIARDAPQVLTPLVCELYPDAWRDLLGRMPRSTRFDDEGIPMAVSPDVRYHMARTADDTNLANPGWASAFDRVELEAVFGDLSEEELARMQAPSRRRRHDRSPNRRGFASLRYGLSKPAAPRDWIVDRLLERGRVTMVTGMPAAGKTTFIAQLMATVAAGKDWSVFSVPSAGRVLSINGEESYDEQVRRARAAVVGMSLARNIADADEIIDRIRHYAMGGAVRIVARDGDRLRLTESGNNLLEEIRDYRPDVVFLDPFSSIHKLDESNNADMADFLYRLQEIAREEGCAILIAHHERKAAGKPQDGTMDAARGASSIAGAVRAMWQVRADGPDGVLVECTKANNFKKPDQPVRFTMRTVKIKGGDEMGLLVPDEAS